MPIRLVARRAFTFQRLAGDRLTCVAGDQLEVTPIEAVLLRARGDVDYAPQRRTEAAPAPKPKRRYRRRDLVAGE